MLNRVCDDYEQLCHNLTLLYLLRHPEKIRNDELVSLIDAYETQFNKFKDTCRFQGKI